MITTNPFSILSETIPAIATQSFVIVMAVLVAIGTIVDIIHKKTLNIFLKMQKKQKNQQKKNLPLEKKLQY